MTEPVTVRVDATPNPHAMKFTVNREVWSGRAATFSTPEEALTAPLARRLLALPGVRGVFLLRDFITIIRTPDADWEPITSAVIDAVRAHFAPDGADC